MSLKDIDHNNIMAHRLRSHTVTVTANHTANPVKPRILVDASAGPVTVTLPSSASGADGQTFTVKKIDESANVVTVTGPEAIDQWPYLLLVVPYDTLTVFATSSQWWAESSLPQIVATVPVPPPDPPEDPPHAVSFSFTDDGLGGWAVTGSGESTEGDWVLTGTAQPPPP